jgi:hypothetical protein
VPTFAGNPTKAGSQGAINILDAELFGDPCLIQADEILAKFQPIPSMVIDSATPSYGTAASSPSLKAEILAGTDTLPVVGKHESQKGP